MSPRSPKRTGRRNNSNSSRITSEPPHIEGVPLPPRWMRRGGFVETGEEGSRGPLYRHSFPCQECAKRKLECLVPPLRPMSHAPGYFYCMACEACSGIAHRKCHHGSSSRKGDAALRWYNTEDGGEFLLEPLPKSIRDKRERARQQSEKKRRPAFIDDSEAFCGRHDSSDYVDDGDESGSTDYTKDSEYSDDGAESDVSEYIDDDGAPGRSRDSAGRYVSGRPDQGKKKSVFSPVSLRRQQSAVDTAADRRPEPHRSEQGARMRVPNSVSRRPEQDTRNPVTVVRPAHSPPEQGASVSAQNAVPPVPEQRTRQPVPGRAPHLSNPRATLNATHPLPRQPPREMGSDRNCNEMTEVQQQPPQLKRNATSASHSSDLCDPSDSSDSDGNSKIIVQRKRMTMTCRPGDFAARGAKRRRIYAPPSPASPNTDCPSDATSTTCSLSDIEVSSQGAYSTAHGTSNAADVTSTTVEVTSTSAEVTSSTAEVTHTAEVDFAAPVTMHAATAATHAVAEVTNATVEATHNASQATHETAETRTEPELETIKLEPRLFQANANGIRTPEPTASPSPSASSPPSNASTIPHDDQVMLLEAEIEATKDERDAAIEECHKVTEERNRLIKERANFLKMYENLLNMYQNGLDGGTRR